MKRNLVTGEAAIILALKVFDNHATVEELVSLLQISVQYTRNTLSNLMSLGIVTSQSGGGGGGSLGFLGAPKQRGSKQAIYVLNKNLEEITKEYPNFMVLIKKTYPEVKSIKDLEHLIEQKKKNLEK